MVSVSFTKVYRQMEMDLPSASKSASANGDSSISVSLFEDGKIYLDNKNIKIEELKSESEKKIFKDKVVSLAVEKKVPFEKFVEIADIIKLGGALKTEITVK
jgi:biopolymer transport protein ExbD